MVCLRNICINTLHKGDDDDDDDDNNNTTLINHHLCRVADSVDSSIISMRCYNRCVLACAGQPLGIHSYTNMSNYSWLYISITPVLIVTHAINSYDYELQLVQCIKT